LPVPRVPSEVGPVQSPHQTFASRRPAAAEDNPPSTGFAALLDDTGAAPPPSPHDHAERPHSNSTAPSTRDPQPDHRAQRRQDRQEKSDDGDGADSTSAQRPSTDAAADGTPATTNADQADAADGTGSDDKSASADAADAAALAAAINAAAAAAQPVASAAAPTAVVLAAASDAAAALPQAKIEPAPGAAASIPAATMADAGAALSALAQGAGDTAAEKAGAGRKGTGITAGTDNAKTRNDTPATNAGNIKSSTTAEAGSEGPGAARPGSQAAMQTGTDPSGKGEPVHPHAGRPLGQEDTPRPGETRLQVDAQALGAADKLATDPTQLATLQPPTNHSANLLPAATQPDATAVPIAGLAVEIAARFQAGNNRFEIRLDPPELGRIDVRLDFNRDGQVTSRLTVDKAETLNLLQRDASDLERALQQAGLKTGDGGLQFALRDQSFGGQNPGPSDRSLPDAARLVIPDPEMTPVETLPSGYGRSLGLGTGVDIRV
jgi:flagellar hook-length control protein FliK